MWMKIDRVPDGNMTFQISWSTKSDVNCLGRIVSYWFNYIVFCEQPSTNFENYERNNYYHTYLYCIFSVRSPYQKRPDISRLIFDFQSTTKVRISSRVSLAPWKNIDTEEFVALPMIYRSAHLLGSISGIVILVQNSYIQNVTFSKIKILRILNSKNYFVDILTWKSIQNLICVLRKKTV